MPRTDFWHRCLLAWTLPSATAVACPWRSWYQSIRKCQAGGISTQRGSFKFVASSLSKNGCAWLCVFIDLKIQLVIHYHFWGLTSAVRVRHGSVQILEGHDMLHHASIRLLLPRCLRAAREGIKASRNGRSPQTSMHGKLPFDCRILGSWYCVVILVILSKMQQFSSWVLFERMNAPCLADPCNFLISNCGITGHRQKVCGSRNSTAVPTCNVSPLESPHRHHAMFMVQDTCCCLKPPSSIMSEGIHACHSLGSVTIFLAANMPCQVSSSLITWPKRQLPVNRALVWSLEEFISTRTFTWSERFRLYPTCVDFWRINGCANFRNLVNDPLDCATWYTNLYSSCNVQAIRYVWIQGSSREVVGNIFER